MAHVRQQIRKKVGVIVTGLASGAGVHTSSVYNLQPGDSRALKIYTLSEGVERDTQKYPRGTQRQLQLIIEAIAKSTVDLDDVLDALCAEVEAAIAADISLGGLVKDVYLETTTIEFNGGADQPHGMATMSWIVEYRVRETEPEVVLA